MHPLQEKFKNYPHLGQPDFEVVSPLGFDGKVLVFTNDSVIGLRSHGKPICPPQCFKATNIGDMADTLAKGWPIIEVHHTHRAERDLTFICSQNPRDRTDISIGEGAREWFKELIQKVRPNHLPSSLRIVKGCGGLFSFETDEWPKERAYNPRKTNQR